MSNTLGISVIWETSEDILTTKPKQPTDKTRKTQNNQTNDSGLIAKNTKHLKRKLGQRAGRA